MSMNMNEIKTMARCCKVFTGMINDLEEKRERCEDECGFTPFLDSKRIEERKKHRESKYRVLKEPDKYIRSLIDNLDEKREEHKEFGVIKPVGKIKTREDLTKHELEMMNIIEKAIGRKLLDDKKSSCRPHTINELFDDDDEEIYVTAEIKNPIEDELEFRRFVEMES